jgi:rod shape-determining protein MreC
VPILDIDLDPSRQRLVLAGGSRDGVRLGQAVIDAGGLIGQIIAVTPTTSTVLLLTDPAHAVPVEIARSGVRLVAYGNGRSDQLTLANVPLSGDVKVGDRIVTSGLGRRFPAGFAVGTVAELRPDDSRAFLLGDVRPAAQLDRGREVLLLKEGGAGADEEASEAVRQAEGPATAIGARAVPDPVPKDAQPRDGAAPPVTPASANATGAAGSRIPAAPSSRRNAAPDSTSPVQSGNRDGSRLALERRELRATRGGSSAGAGESEADPFAQDGSQSNADAPAAADADAGNPPRTEPTP